MPRPAEARVPEAERRQRAVERSAYAEAISSLTAALDLLTTLPETRERSQQELSVQMTLGTALRVTKGGGAREVEQLFTHARELCEQIGDPTQLFRVLWGLWSGYNARGDELSPAVAAAGQAGRSTRASDAHLWLVHRGL
jgi:hypothetical protein